MIHLHLLYFRGPAMLRDLTSGYALCGRRCDRQELTTHVEDAQCADCLARARNREGER